MREVRSPIEHKALVRGFPSAVSSVGLLGLLAVSGIVLMNSVDVDWQGGDARYFNPHMPGYEPCEHCLGLGIRMRNGMPRPCEYCGSSGWVIPFGALGVSILLLLKKK